MSTIEARLAQDIVDRTMRIIPFNVNVMDGRGIILGSGETSRIGELHSGALLALAQNRTVEIDAATSRTLRGVKPGVNIPLTVRGQICGVVGLTGEPDTVRQFGELVRVTAEMILEQAQLIGELQREKRYREEFVFQLIHHGATPMAIVAGVVSTLPTSASYPCSRWRACVALGARWARVANDSRMTSSRGEIAAVRTSGRDVASCCWQC